MTNEPMGDDKSLSFSPQRKVALLLLKKASDDVDVFGTHLAGAMVTIIYRLHRGQLSIFCSTKGGLTIDGSFGGKIAGIEFEGKGIFGRTGKDLKREDAQKVFEALVALLEDESTAPKEPTASNIIPIPPLSSYLPKSITA